MGWPFRTPLSWSERPGLHTIHSPTTGRGLPEGGFSLALFRNPWRVLIAEDFLPAALPEVEIISVLILKCNFGSKGKQLPHNPSSGTSRTYYINSEVLFVNRKMSLGIMCSVLCSFPGTQNLDIMQPVPSPVSESITIISLWLNHTAVGRRPQLPTIWASP